MYLLDSFIGLSDSSKTCKCVSTNHTPLSISLSSVTSLQPNDVDILTGNLPDVSKWQQSFYRSIQECCRLSINQQTMGTLFLKMANEVDL